MKPMKNGGGWAAIKLEPEPAYPAHGSNGNQKAGATTVKMTVPIDVA
jgi:hypothetical protein